MAASYNATAPAAAPRLWHTAACHRSADTAMKKSIAAALLMLSLSAFAQQAWIRYAETDEATLYFDSLRTRKMGDTSFVWDLHDLKVPATDGQGKQYRSVLYATEYQCRARKRRILGIVRHAEAMGKGEATEVVQTGDWTPAPKDSIAGQLFDHICE